MTFKMRWYLYIAQCKDGSLYTGITTNPARRAKEHNSGIGAKSLAGKLPVKLVYKEGYNSKIDAAKREREIKGWRREKKLLLVRKGLP